MFGEIPRKNHQHRCKFRWNLSKNDDFFQTFEQNFEKSLTNFCEYFELGAVRRCVNLVDLERCQNMTICLQKSASIQKRTSPLKFDHFRNPQPNLTASDLSTKAGTSKDIAGARPSAWKGTSVDATLILGTYVGSNSNIEPSNWLLAILDFGPQTVEGSFSSVSKPNFATQCSLESSGRDLSDLHSFAPLESEVGKIQKYLCTAPTSKFQQTFAT